MPFQPLPLGVGFDFVASNANRTGNNFLITNTTIANHRARGMLIKVIIAYSIVLIVGDATFLALSIQASHGQILNNHVYGSTMGALIVTPELFW